MARAAKLRSMHAVPAIWATILIGSLCPAVASADDAEVSLAPLATKEWDFDSAAHLLRRAGFSGTPADVQKLYEMGLDGAVDHLVDFEQIKWEIAPPPIDPLLHEDIDRAELRKLTEEERQKLREERRRAEQRTFEEVRLWWIDRMVNSPRPLEEKMTLFWHGHFTSGMREVRDAIYMYEQNRFLRNNALGRFRDLLVGISKDRAMLVYLDNRSNVKRKPNENYARELMELFTLGVGNYGEDDIKAAARAFTGWSLDPQGFVFRTAVHDDGVKHFLGKKGNFDGYHVIDIILDHPACSRFMARNLLEFFCRPKPEKQLVENLALVIRKNEFHFKPVMKTLFKSKAFYAPSARGCLIKGPVELLVMGARELGVGIHDLRAAERAMAAMGQELMQPPNVKGWDGGPKWINTATLFNRYNFVGGLINGGGPGERGRRVRARMLASAERRKNAVTDVRPPSVEDELGDESEASDGKNDEEDAMMRKSLAAESRLGGGRQPVFDPIPIIRDNNVTTPEEIVDYFAKHLLAVELPGIKREQLISYLIGEPGKPFDFESKDASARVRMTVHLLTSTPEYQLY